MKASAEAPKEVDEDVARIEVAHARGLDDAAENLLRLGPRARTDPTGDFTIDDRGSGSRARPAKLIRMTAVSPPLVAAAYSSRATISPMDIGIICSGQIGSILARRLAALGHQVRIANSRGPESLAVLATETGATASTVEQVTSAKDVLIVTIPRKAVADLPRGLFARSAAVVVDTGNYYPVGPLERRDSFSTRVNQPPPQ